MFLQHLESYGYEWPCLQRRGYIGLFVHNAEGQNIQASVSRMMDDLIVTGSSPNHWSISAVWGRWEMLQEIMSVVNRIYRTFVCSCSPALVPGDVSRCPPFKPQTHARVPNLSNDLEKRLFLMAIKDTITVSNHSPWGWIESYQWPWQLSITRGGVSVTPPGEKSSQTSWHLLARASGTS